LRNVLFGNQHYRHWPAPRQMKSFDAPTVQQRQSLTTPV
jgi:hypothetical protein